jgi:hypothetical protein
MHTVAPRGNLHGSEFGLIFTGRMFRLTRDTKLLRSSLSLKRIQASINLIAGDCLPTVALVRKRDSHVENDLVFELSRRIQYTGHYSPMKYCFCQTAKSKPERGAKMKSNIS